MIYFPSVQNKLQIKENRIISKQVSGMKDNALSFFMVCSQIGIDMDSLRTIGIEKTSLI